MSIAVPKEIRDGIQQKIWDKADDLNWSRLSDVDRTMWYENWSREKDVGGVLAHFMDARKVRVYIKDSLLKPYLRNQLEDDAERVLVAVGFRQNAVFEKTYNKPHGRLLTDNEVVCWGNSRDWKLIIISVFERAHYLVSGVPYAAVLIEGGRTTSADTRRMITDIGKRLGLQHVTWID